MSYSASPSTTASPTKSSRWSGSPVKLQKAKPNAKALSLFVNTKNTVQKTPSASFFKQYNNNIAKPHYSVDLSILHESRIFKNLVQAADRRKEREAKRDPILQDNNEETAVFKCSVKRFASADRVTPCADVDFKRSKHVGSYNPIYSPRPENDKPQGVRTFVKTAADEDTDGFVRQRKFRCTSSDNSRNPITEGCEQSAVFKRWRKAVEPSGESQRMNDKKHLLTSERGTSTRGRVHRDVTLTLGDYDSYNPAETLNTAQSVQSARILTPFEQKMRGFIKDTITYQGNQSYRAENVSDKPTQMNFKELSEARDNTRLFGRKITLR